jgi:hypothetical protein
MENLSYRELNVPSEPVEGKIFVLINKTIDLLAKTKSEKGREALLRILKRATDTLEKFLQGKHRLEEERCRSQIVVRVPGGRWGR